MSKTLTEKLPGLGRIPTPFSVTLVKPGLITIKALYHILFWVVFYLFNALMEGSFLDNYIYGFYANFVKLPLQIGLVYFNLYYLLPKFILTKKYNHYFLSLIIILALIVLIKRVIIFEVVYPATCPVSYETESLITFSNFFLMLNSEIYLIGITSAIKMSIDWVKNNQITKALEKEKLEAELGLLKAQIQPHFFFNTLNNLYSLTLTKSDQAPGVVQKLSELMSYLLYDCEQPMVYLRDEVKLIHNYIDLEKLRFGKRLQIKFDIDGNFSDKKIPPYIILPFVENAFKHCHSQLDTVVIKITLEVMADSLVLSIINPVGETETKTPDSKGGIGLKNAHRRLGLIYGEDFSLEVKNQGTAFSVRLHIPLES